MGKAAKSPKAAAAKTSPVKKTIKKSPAVPAKQAAAPSVAVGTKKVCKPLDGVRGKFVLFGDSITQQSFSVGGWGARLADNFARKVDVVNRGFSGYTSRHAAYIVKQVLEGSAMCQKPDVVTIFFGANDSVEPGMPQHVPVKEYEANITAVVKAVKKHSPHTHVIVLCPPPVDAHKWAKFCAERDGLKEVPAQTRNNTNVEKYGAAAKRAAAKAGAEVIDTYSVFKSRGDYTHLLSDGLHLTSEGNEVVFQELIRLSSVLPKLDFENWDVHYPFWSDMSERTDWKQLMDTHEDSR